MMHLLLERGTRRIVAAARAADPDAWGWYYEAREIAQRLAKRYDVSTAQAAGIIAALSPGCNWERNIDDATRLLRDGSNFSGAGTYGANVKKAQRIRRGEKPLRVLGGPKVVNFYLCIMRPWSRYPVCVDRHAMALALGRKLSDKERRALGKPAQYRQIASRYREAAALMGAVPSSVQAAAWAVERG